MKVAVLFDLFTERGGAERVAIILAKHLNADIYTTYVDWNKVDKDLKKLNIHEIGLTLKNAKLLTYTEISRRFSKLKLTGYDAYLFSRAYCFSAATNHHPNVWIATGILTSLYDLYDFFYKRLALWQKPIYKLWYSWYRKYDQKCVSNFDRILANCETTKKKIKKYYGREAGIAYHPVETKRFYCKSFQDFYLAPGRLVKDKCFDLIVESFKEMPDKKLVIVGDGPERAFLKKLAGDSKNIEFVGSLDLDRLIELYSKCTATIFITAFTGWGLIPVESMAAGKPCITAVAGTESVIHGKTGYIIKPTKEELKKHVRLLTPDKARKMKNACIKRAREFDVEIFLKTVENEIKNLMKKQMR